MRRNGLISLLKFLLISFIVIYHYTLITHTTSNFLFKGGAIYVEFFFIVSGFYMTREALKNKAHNLGLDTWKFMWKKFLKLFPYVFIGFVLSFIVFAYYEKYTFLEIANSVWDLLCLKVTAIPTTDVNRPDWYISAMLLSMFIVYPLISKYKEKYIYLIAPIIVLFGMGYLSRLPKTLGTWDYYDGHLYKGFIRAFIEINLGAIIYLLIEYMKKIKFTKFSKFLMTIIFIACFGMSVIIPGFVTRTIKYNTFLILTITIFTTLALSEMTYLNKMFNHKFFYWLEKISLPLFLVHNSVRYFIFYSHIFENINYNLGITLNYLISLLIAIIVYALVRILQNKDVGNKIKNKLVTT